MIARQIVEERGLLAVIDVNGAPCRGRRQKFLPDAQDRLDTQSPAMAQGEAAERLGDARLARGLARLRRQLSALHQKIVDLVVDRVDLAVWVLRRNPALPYGQSYKTPAQSRRIRGGNRLFCRENEKPSAGPVLIRARAGKIKANRAFR